MYRVELSPHALSDIDSIVATIHADSPINAVRWRRRLFEKIEALALMPRSYSFAPEHYYCPQEIRQTIFGRYRILFTVRDSDSLIYVLSIRHGARLFMKSKELDER